MKNDSIKKYIKLQVISGLSLVIGMQALASTATSPEYLYCFNKMYRDASLTVSKSTVAIQDDYIEGFQELRLALDKSLGGTGRISHIQHTRLILDASDAGCSFGANPFLISCNGKTQSKTARLRTVVDLIEKDGISGVARLSADIEVKSFKLNTQLENRSGNSSVAANIMDVEAEAIIVLNGESITLKWTPFFYTNNGNEENSSSACTIQ